MQTNGIAIEDISPYPAPDEITPGHRPLLHPLFVKRAHGISEFTFANVYLFRRVHCYRLSRLEGGLLMLAGEDHGVPFFMLPFGMPSEDTLRRLLKDFAFLKCADEAGSAALSRLGYAVAEDPDNFDYLYSREEMATLSGRRFHKKKNLVNLFLSSHECGARPLAAGETANALAVLDEWAATRAEPGDYEAAKEALLHMDELALCGGIFHVDGKPAAYILGEELTPDTFVIHFEKGLAAAKGVLQYVNQAFASILPSRYRFINREQDLGDEGLRHSKQSYRPVGFVKKYRVTLKRP